MSHPFGTSTARGRAVLVLLATVGAAGCSTYRPVSRAALVPAAEVRVRITREYGADLQSIFMVPPATLEGRVIRADGAGLLLETVTAGVQYGTRTRPLTQRISVPWPHVVEVEERRPDRARTALVAGAVGAVTLAAVLSLLDSDAGGTPPPGPGGNDEARLPASPRLP